MKIVVAYSGGLDTSILLTWLKEQYNAEIIAFCADVGQEEELKGLDKKAVRTGASKCYIDDLTEEFAKDFIYPMVRAGAIYENQYFLGTSIARPLIAKRQVEIARLENADAVAHGATGKGNDQVRFELTFAALAPDLQVIAPWRTWDFKGRTDLINYAKSKGIAVPVTAKKPYSMDRNMLHISFESGILEDPWAEPPADMFKLSVSPEKAPNKPEYVELEFEQGNCVAVNGKRLSPANVMRALNKLGGKHGVGRVDLVENRFVGMKSRGVYETPGGSILHSAHRQIETLTMDREVMHLRDGMIPKYSELVYNGFWYAPEREFLQAAIDQSQEKVSGTVRLKLYKGNIITAGRKSKLSLYNPHVATMEADKGAYNQGDATGFIRLNGLRLRSWANREKTSKGKKKKK
ncbi:MAG: argininosuccinate synthase [Verrucomicrobiales bacterium]|jgi:argininosuccinate synthase|nr:argininosuccinate synthase [Verrucomicrobiales bacterium]